MTRLVPQHHATPQDGLCSFWAGLVIQHNVIFPQQGVAGRLHGPANLRCYTLHSRSTK